MGTTAQELSHTITKALKAKNVDFSKIVALSYDGVSNMRGCYGGLQGKMRVFENKLFIYIYIYIHQY